jgi:hypothetical protein
MPRATPPKPKVSSSSFVFGTPVRFRLRRLVGHTPLLKSRYGSVSIAAFSANLNQRKQQTRCAPSLCGSERSGRAAPLCINHKVFAANSKPRRRRSTWRSLPLFGHRDQAFALGLFSGRLARTPDGFCLLAGLALGGFFIRLAALHLTKNALALHFLFEHPESLIDIVVSNEYLQNASNLLLALDAPSSC